MTEIATNPEWDRLAPENAVRNSQVVELAKWTNDHCHTQFSTFTEDKVSAVVTFPEGFAAKCAELGIPLVYTGNQGVVQEITVLGKKLPYSTALIVYAALKATKEEGGYGAVPALIKACITRDYLGGWWNGFDEGEGSAYYYKCNECGGSDVDGWIAGFDVAFVSLGLYPDNLPEAPPLVRLSAPTAPTYANVFALKAAVYEKIMELGQEQNWCADGRDQVLVELFGDDGRPGGNQLDAILDFTDKVHAAIERYKSNGYVKIGTLQRAAEELGIPVPAVQEITVTFKVKADDFDVATSALRQALYEGIGYADIEIGSGL